MEQITKKAKPTLGNRLRRFSESRIFYQILPTVFLILLGVFFSVATKGRFSQPISLKIIADQALIVGTVATGAAFIFASGNVNLAMGATTVLTATVAGIVYNATNSVAVMILVALALGVVLMVVSVMLSTLFRVRVMFVTIVMMLLLASLQQSILGGATVSLPYSMTTALADMGFPYIAFLVYFVFAAVLFHWTDIGRGLRMLGTNEECAEQTGIRKRHYLTLAFILGGIGCGIGALLAIIRAGSVGQNTLSSLNMDCMLALVLGGMSIFGGSRSYIYAGIIGSVTVVVLNQGLLMMNVDSTIIQGVRGIIFLLLVCTAQKRPQGLPAPEG